MKNEKNLNPNSVSFSIFGERLRVFYDEDRIRIAVTDAAEILGFTNGRNAVARYCPSRITHLMKTDRGKLAQVSAITEEVDITLTSTAPPAISSDCFWYNKTNPIRHMAKRILSGGRNASR